MDKLTAIKIKYDDGTYSDEIPVSVLAENVEWDSTHTLVDVLGSIDVDVTGTIQDQISQLFNEKVSTLAMQSYIANQVPTYVSTWLNTNVNPVGSAVIVDSSLSISGAAGDAQKIGSIIAPIYSSSSTYTTGDHVIYNGNLYICNTAITEGEAWTAAHWTQVAVGDEVFDLKSALSDELGFNIIDTTYSGYISSQNGAITGGGYKYTDLIPVHVGDKIIVHASGSGAVFIIGMYANASANADLTNSIKGDNSYRFYEAVIPSGIEYIRACCSSAYELQVYTKVLADLQSDVSDLQSDVSDLQSDVSDISRYGAIQYIPYENIQAPTGITVVDLGDGKFDISGSVQEAAYIVFAMSTSNFPKGIEPGSTYIVLLDASSDSGIKLELFQYVSDAWDRTFLYVLGQDSITIPQNSTGMLIRLVLSSSKTYDHEIVEVQLIDSETKAMFDDKIESVYQITDAMVYGGEADVAYTLNETNGYISSSTGQITSGGYKYSEMIHVVESDVFNFASSASSAVFAIAMYANETDTTADLNKSIKGISSIIEQHFVIPEGINYIRICFPIGQESINYLKKVYKSINRMADDISNLATEIESLHKITFEPQLLKKRKASVSFIFDDGSTKDAQIKEIFDAHGMKCGFAIIPPVDTRYIEYFADGYELLAHWGNPPQDQTEANMREMLKTSHDAITNAVGECHGWVTPNSNMATQFRPLVYDYYEYGYTQYKGNTVDPASACMDKTMLSYTLWRSSLQSLSLAEQKAIIDYALANNLLICFYGHAAGLDGTDYETTENLNALLDYCESVGIQVELPYKSTLNYFSYRHNEDRE
mgnify:CR=1 FL=1